MGNKQNTTANWSVDDWAYGTGENAVPVEDVVAEVRKIPAKYFGGKAIENDASMHAMQQDLLSFDDTLKRIFFRRKKKKQSEQDAQAEEYYYPDEQAMPEEELTDSAEDPTYLAPTYPDRDASSSMPTTDSSRNAAAAAAATTNKNKLIWRCSQCTADNKVTETSCRRCGQAETKL